MAEQTSTPGGRGRKFIIALAVIGILALIITGINYYLRYWGPNVNGNKAYLYIRTGSTFADVYHTIREEKLVNDTTTFMWAAHNMNYVNGKIKPGKYKLTEGMNNRYFINMLKAGNQEPVTLNFHNLRLKSQFAKSVSQQLEPDSASVNRLLDSAAFVKQYGFTTDNVYTMFLPNSYQLYWNTTPEKFFERMHTEYEKFWTPARKQQAAVINLTPIQVSILASIVDAEALHDDEMPMIAGLYLNRLKRGIRLEADPTVIYATGDFTIKRVLRRYLSTPSAYNTYINKGLPPGPIMMPSVNAVKAVLNYKKHDYIYMCAKEDFSGYHNYATNVSDHLANARRFQQALDARGIKR